MTYATPRERVSIHSVPSLVRHTWRESADLRVIPVRTGDTIDFDTGECLVVFYGAPGVCPCGLTALERV